MLCNRPEKVGKDAGELCGKAPTGVLATNDKDVIEALEADILVKGADYSADTVVGADVVRRRGGRVEIVPLVPEQSTAAIVVHHQQATYLAVRATPEVAQV